MKKIAKKIVAAILGWQVRRLRKKNEFKIIAITGSIGKTSTKFAIAHVLSKKYKIQFQKGNYNDIVSVPLAIFGHQLPNIFNPLAWLAIFLKNERLLRQLFPYQVVVLELGTDAPGQTEEFMKYVHADIGVLTAITPEHMEFFGDLDAVAREEMAISQFSDQLFANQDLIPDKYLNQLPEGSITYGVKKPAKVMMLNIEFDEEAADFEIVKNQETIVKGEHEQITEPQLYSICAAAAVSHELGLTGEEIESGIASIKPVSGRMQHLRAVNGSTIIDDTYNASPEAMRAALDTLYRLKAPQKIAVLGDMNELGKYSQKEHQRIGEYCDPKKIDLIVTIGQDANKFLAPAAEARGCSVKTFEDPYAAGEFVKSQAKPGSTILVKGSQNRVFAEEAVKILLANPADAEKLVRQTPYWLKKKEKSFRK